MTSYFSDGKSAKINAIAPTLLPNELCFSVADRDYVWQYSELVLIDMQYRKLSNALDNEARLTLDEQAFSQLQDLVPNLTNAAARNRHIKLVLSLASLGAAVSALVFFGVPMAAAPLAKITPPKYELQLSKSIEAQLDLGLKFCKASNSEGEAALQRLADKIGANAELGFPIKVGVIDFSMPNAFAMPAGKIWFTKGLLQEAQNGEEIAAVMAHEIGHVESRDVLVSLYRAMGFGIILDAVVGGGSGAGQQLIMLGANLTDLKNSRKVEAKADERGLELLQAANIDGSGLARFFERLEKLEKEIGLGDWSEFMSSHPNSGRRSIIARQNAKRGGLAMTPAEFAQVKAICN